MCDDETSAAKLVLDYPQTVTTGWVGNDLFLWGAYPNVNEVVSEVLQTISERERDIISHRYGFQAVDEVSHLLATEYQRGSFQAVRQVGLVQSQLQEPEAGGPRHQYANVLSFCLCPF